MATHSSILAWRISRVEEAESQRVGHEVTYHKIAIVKKREEGIREGGREERKEGKEEEWEGRKGRGKEGREKGRRERSVGKEKLEYHTTLVGM